MFYKTKINPFYTLGQGQYLSFLNSDNLKKLSKRKIRSYQKKHGSDAGWDKHKSYVLWKWINENFAIKESFIINLEKNIKKLEIKITPKEENLIFILKGLFFATWRPLKEMIVRFDLDKKETIYFYEPSGHIYQLLSENIKDYKKNVSGDLYFSNRSIYLCDKHQKILKKIYYKDIVDVEFSEFGVILNLNNVKYLFRSQNKYMTYIVLQRMMPKLGLDINKIENLYNYFDFWNKALLKFN